MQIGWGGVVFTRLEKAEGANGRKALKGASADSAGATPADGKGNGAQRIGGGGGGGGGGGKRGSKKEKVEVVANGGEGSGVDQALETMQYDRMAIAYLSLLLLPLVVGYSAKKLVMDEHAGWYSWALQSLTVNMTCSLL